jgi:hypothetical protein
MNKIPIHSSLLNAISHEVVPLDTGHQFEPTYDEAADRHEGIGIPLAVGIFVGATVFGCGLVVAVGLTIRTILSFF